MYITHKSEEWYTFKTFNLHQRAYVPANYRLHTEPVGAENFLRFLPG